MNPDRWEFANAGFLGGQRHLLAGIRRRLPAAPTPSSCAAVEGELKRLRRDQEALKRELAQLERQQEDARATLLDMERRVLGTKRRQEQCKAFLTRAVGNPAFLDNLARRNGFAAGPPALNVTTPSAGGVTTDMIWYELLGEGQAEIDVEVEDHVAPAEDRDGRGGGAGSDAAKDCFACSPSSS